MRYLTKVVPGVLLAALLTMSVGVRATLAAPVPEGLIKTVQLPNIPPPAGPASSFDIGWVDPGSQRYFIADRVNASVDIIDASNGNYLGALGGFVGALPTGFGGPNGVLYAPDLNEVWSGDGNSTVKVHNPDTKQLLATIPTGGTARADELAYDPDHHLILIANDREPVAFVVLISTTTRTVVKRIDMPQAKDSSGATGLEQPVYDPIQKVFLMTIPNSTVNPGGEVVVIDPVTLSLTKTYALTGCNPNGAAMGPRDEMLLGCGHGPAGSQINLQIINAATGALIKTIPQTGGPDEVWYNPGDNRYYAANTGWTTTGLIGGPASPVLGIIDASNNSFVENVPISTSRSGSVAVNPVNNWVFIPIVQPANVPPLPTMAGIGIFAPMGGQGFKLQSQGSTGKVQFNWTGSANQPSYTLLKISAAGQTSISVPGGATNSFVDTVTPGTGACYQLLMNDAKGTVSGRSDMYCALPGSGSATGPRNVTINLNPDAAGALRTASLTWAAPASGTVSNYMVLPIGTTRFQVVGSSTLAATDATGGAAICYMVGVVGTGVSGIGDIVCAVPNTSRLD